MLIALFSNNFIYFENLSEKDFTLVTNNPFHDTNTLKNPHFFLKKIFEKANKIRNYKIFKYITEFIYIKKVYEDEVKFFSLINNEEIIKYLLEKYNFSKEKEYYSGHNFNLIYRLFTQNILNNISIFERYINGDEYFNIKTLSDIYEYNTFIKNSDDVYKITLDYFKNKLSKNKYFIKHIIKNITTNSSSNDKHILLKEEDLIELIKLSIIGNHSYFPLPDNYDLNVIVENYLNWVGVEENIYSLILNSHFEEFKNECETANSLLITYYKKNKIFTEEEHNKRAKELIS
jgi:hypothetical protein